MILCLSYIKYGWLLNEVLYRVFTTTSKSKIKHEIVKSFVWSFLSVVSVVLLQFLNLCLAQLGPKAEDVEKPVNPFVFLLRFVLGAMAGTYYVLVPIYMWLKDQIVPKGRPIWKARRKYGGKMVQNFHYLSLWDCFTCILKSQIGLSDAQTCQVLPKYATM